MNIPPLGTALPVQIIDNSLPGHTITQVKTSISDVSALQSYLQTSLPEFTCMFYYPDQALLQIQTSGDITDTSAIQALIQAYPNPSACITSTQTIGIAPISACSSSWKTIFVLMSPSYDNKNLIGFSISSALLPASPSDVQLSSSEYSVRAVAVDTNSILGGVTASNLVFGLQNIALMNVPTHSFSLEFQVYTTGGSYVTLRSISLIYQSI